jgi:hypothetical protein
MPFPPPFTSVTRVQSPSGRPRFFPRGASFRIGCLGVALSRRRPRAGKRAQRHSPIWAENQASLPRARLAANAFRPHAARAHQQAQGVIERYRKKWLATKSAYAFAWLNGPGWGQVAEYLLIHLLDLRRSGWQVHSASRQESAGKGQRGRKIRGLPGFRWPGIVFDSGFLTTFASTLELRLRQRDVRFQACAMDGLATGSLKRRPRRLYVASNAHRASCARPEGRSESVRDSVAQGRWRLGDGAWSQQSDRSQSHAQRSNARSGVDPRA